MSLTGGFRPRPSTTLARGLGSAALSTWAEPFGLAVAEAIVRGVPVVTTSLGGFVNTVEQGVTGLLVPNGDTTRLAAALDDVASGRAFPEHVIAEAAVRRLAERLSPRRHVERLHAVFEQ
jgi:type III pantothenate kinase